MSSEVVWGGSETLDGQSTVVSTATVATTQDVAIAELTADLVTSSADDVVARLADAGIRFVLLAPAPAPESDAARALRLEASTSMNQRDTLDAVGDTVKGSLWRVTSDVADRPGVPTAVHAIARLIAVVQLIVVGIAILLALPTATSRRAARRTPRVVGPHWREGR